MRRQVRFFAVVLLLVVGLSACKGLRSGMTLTEDNNGKTVSLKEGDTLTVKLASNPSTGYSWGLKSVDAAVLDALGKPEYKQERNIPGGGGIETWRFQAVAAGQTTLTLIYHRSWEKDSPPDRTFTLNVTVTAK